MIPITAIADAEVVRFPRAPHTLEESGLPFDLVLQLVLKTLHFSGGLTGAELGHRLGLQYSVIEPVLQHLKLVHLVEVAGSGLVAGPAYLYRITSAGRERAHLFLERSHYVGKAPVLFDQYEAYMQEFAEAVPRTATRERVRTAFRELVLGETVLDQLGPAINGAHSIFVYGPPGNGKTVISQAIQNLLDGDIAVPYAIDCNGHTVQVYDPVHHCGLETAESAERAIDTQHSPDARWVRCRRPLVTVGGELSLDSLDLSYSTSSRFYQAPVQLTANGGVLVIDDFGRQKCSPVALLNRWITPLETRIDYLTLQTGQKMPVPFVVLIVFATNIRPADLVDEAFLRRIHYKVFAEPPSPQDFKQIFERHCLRLGLEYDEAIVSELIVEITRRRGLALRGCHPRDLIDQAVSLAEYRGEPRRLTTRLLGLACNSYFVDERPAEARGN